MRNTPEPKGKCEISPGQAAEHKNFNMDSKPYGEVAIQSYPTLLQLKKLFESSTDLVTCVDLNGAYIFTSGALKEILGYDTDELTGFSALNMVVPEDREKTIEIGLKLRDGNLISDFDNRLIHKSGKSVDISWSILLFKEYGVMLGFGRDITQRNERERSNMLYSNRITSLLENISDGFYAINRDWKFTYFNAKAEEMLSRRREDVLDKNIWEEFPEAITTQLYSSYHHAMKENQSGSLDLYYKPLNSWFRVNYHPSPEGITIFFRNVTRQREDEKQRQEYVLQIKKQNSLLSNILENMQQGFITMDEQEVVQYWNKNAEEITSKSASEMLGKPLKEGLDFCRDPNFIKRLKLAGQDPQQSNFEYFSDYLKRWMDFNVSFSTEGYSIFFRDITQRKSTEEELRRLSMIVKETFNNVIITDAEGGITWVNRAFLSNTGYSAEEVYGKKPGSFLQGPESDPATVMNMRKRIRRKEPFHIEIVNYRKDQTKFWVEIHCQPIFDEQGNVREFFAIQSDITERKNLQIRMAQNQKEWQERITEAVIRAQETERAVVSQELHDNVNQVLTTVKLYNELCLSGTDQQQALLEKSITLLQESIAEIRKLSRRLSAPSLGNIRLDESIRDLVNTLSVASPTVIKMETFGVEKIRIPPELHLSIYRILQEHLTNILNHAHATQARIELRAENRKILLHISDNGVGFNLNEKRSGIGITNMIARAQNMHGNLHISSMPGEGCTLKAVFPLKTTKHSAEKGKN